MMVSTSLVPVPAQADYAIEKRIPQQNEWKDGSERSTRNDSRHPMIQALKNSTLRYDARLKYSFVTQATETRART